MRVRSFLWGALAGAATGALLGILFAPDKGERTRRRISKRSAAYVDAVKDKATEIKDKASEIIDEAAHKTEMLKEEVSDLAKRGKDALSGLTS